MNSDWKTTLMSKGLSLNQQLNKKIERQLAARGLRLSAVDFASFVEHWAPKTSRDALSYVLNFLRPVVMGMGFRISRLSDEKIEVIIPARSKNKSEEGSVHESVLLAAGIEGAKTLWLRHAPLGDFHIRIEEFSFKNIKNSTQEVRMRMEAPETLRQSVLGQLRVMNQASIENHIQFFEEGDQLIAELQLRLQVSTTSLLGSSSSGRNE